MHCAIPLYTAGENFPRGQSEHSSDPFLGAYLPGAHEVHLGARNRENRPAEHSEHCVLPVYTYGAKRPLAHGTHSALPLLLAKCPRGHPAHRCAPFAEYFPLGHGPVQLALSDVPSPYRPAAQPVQAPRPRPTEK